MTAFNKKWDELTEATSKKRPADNYVLCLTEVPGQIPPTKLFARGDFNQPRQEVAPGELGIEARVRITGKTGVEMEALLAVSAAALTVYDMCKAIDRGIVIGPIQLEEKRGGASGRWTR